MPLTLRPTRLSRDPKAEDWNIFDGGNQPVGRIYKDNAAPTESVRWFWALQITGAHQAGVETTGRAPALARAKDAFKKSYEAWQQWSVTGDWRHKIDDAVSAEIIRWDGGRFGVNYTFADGAREVRAVVSDDWPVIRRLEREGKLSCCSDEAREAMAEVIRLGVDR